MSSDAPNWIAARLECSPEILFDELKDMVQADVKKAQGLPLRGEVRFDQSVPDSFGVVVVEKASGFMLSRRTFVLRESKILVNDTKGTTKMQASVRLQDDLECTLVVNGKQLKLWQFSRRALEDLFFPSSGAGSSAPTTR